MRESALEAGNIFQDWQGEVLQNFWGREEDYLKPTKIRNKRIIRSLPRQSKTITDICQYQWPFLADHWGFLTIAGCIHVEMTTGSYERGVSNFACQVLGVLGCMSSPTHFGVSWSTLSQYIIYIHTSIDNPIFMWQPTNLQLGTSGSVYLTLSCDVLCSLGKASAPDGIDRQTIVKSMQLEMQRTLDCFDLEVLSSFSSSFWFLATALHPKGVFKSYALFIQSADWFW